MGLKPNCKKTELNISLAISKPLKVFKTEEYRLKHHP
jgi:hypothetical protein